MPKILIAFLLAAGVSGCVPAMIASAGLGYMIADEVLEGDGKMDPLERLRGKENADPLAEREVYREGEARSRIEEYERAILKRAQVRVDSYGFLHGPAPRGR